VKEFGVRIHIQLFGGNMLAKRCGELENAKSGCEGSMAGCTYHSLALVHT
jgi:hypothetical protein